MQKGEIKSMLEELMHGSDQFVVDIKLSPARLAVFIDKPSGITLDECVALNRKLQAKLDESGLLETHELEVSSPGMDMPLMVPQQYKRRIGQEINIITIDGQQLKGKLEAAGENDISILVVSEKKENKKKVRTESLQTVPYNTIKESKLILNLKFK